jgi:chemotaxis protein methyltransferase CheR
VPLFVTAKLMIGAASIAFASLPLAIGSLMGSTRKRYLYLFSIAAFLGAAEEFSDAWRYRSANVPELILATRFFSGFQSLFAMALVWFVAYYANLRPAWIPKVVTGYGVAVVALHVWLPALLIYGKTPDFGDSYQRSGQRILQPIEVLSPWYLAVNLFALLATAYLTWGCITLWRQKPRGKATWFIVGLSPTVLLACPHELVGNLGIFLPPPYLYSLALLILVITISLGLVRESVQSAKLTHDVEADGRRWRSFLKNVNLLVAECDRGGWFAHLNPFFLRISGYTESELIGRSFATILPDTEGHFSESLDSPTAGEVPPNAKADLVTKQGARRTIIWSHVPLSGLESSTPGILSVGVDVTEELRAKADQALQELEKAKSSLEAENIYLKEEAETIMGSPNIIGHSGSIRYVLQKIRQVSKTEATVLIEGETGVGKELVARAIHEESHRSKGPFIRVNCAALPPTLIESELFGHERGSFTGADRLRKGRFELAEGGTLFLDEAAELSHDMQAKLLRVLQESEYERVGGSRTLKADVRVLAATNRNLQADVSSGRFREDLYYRLQVFPITVPPLRERREDIPLLVQHFVHALAVKHGKSIREVPGNVIATFMQWDWPGNVRELANVVELAVITSKGERLSLPPEFRLGHSISGEAEGDHFMSLAKMERQYILRVLERTNWRVSGRGGAAEILQLHPNTLRTRMQKLGISKNSDRGAGPESANSLAT